MMKIKRYLFCALFIFIFATFLFAEDIEIAGLKIPLIEGAQLVKGEQRQRTQARIVTYTVDRPLSEVTGFYESFLKENGFIVMGGAEEGGFNASVKKDEVMFTLRIYSQGERTVLQFIW